MIRRVWFIGVSFLWANISLAHHGVSYFDHNKEVNLEGVITKLGFVNPHSWLYFDVEDENGNTVNWLCEMRAATALKRSGWTREMFRKGARVSVKGSPSKNRSNTCYVSTLVFEDGRSVDRYSQLTDSAPKKKTESAQRLANGNLNIGGDWVAEQKVLSDATGVSGAFLPLSVVEKLKPGEIPEGERAFPGTRGTPMSFEDIDIKTPGKWPEPVAATEAGRQAAKQFDSLTLNERLLSCQPTNILADWSFDFHANKIIQEKDTITMKYGFMDLSRTIYLNKSQHPDNIEASLAGHSIGRWENDILIVDTIAFKPGKIMRVTEAMYSEQMHVVERFSLDKQTMALKRDYVAEDPLYFEGQYTGSDVVYPANFAHEPYNCEDLSRNAISPKSSE